MDAQKAREAAAAEQAKSETSGDPYGVGQGSGFGWFKHQGMGGSRRTRRSRKSKRARTSRRSGYQALK